MFFIDSDAENAEMVLRSSNRPSLLFLGFNKKATSHRMVFRAKIENQLKAGAMSASAAVEPSASNFTISM